ncbi:MAG: hypothetical protein WBQ79_12815, partial [Acidobacteriaceae bacterium]
MNNDNSPCKVRHIAVLLLMLVLSGAGCLLRAEQRPSQTQNGSGAYATGRYRNLFAEMGHSQNAIRAKVEAAYRQLFHGDPQTQAVFFSAGRNADGP